ncbi:MAG TPA: acyltransferase [Candidatus Angelobacter sp.]|jgi:peptidoglycan/LPS O-acetylase OafA/YrhL|nr:acyltransferase [Candidatus Angelobacter sp.]
MTTVAETQPATAVGVRSGGQRAERFYRPELDVLRFFAFLGVFIFHAAPRTMDFYNAAGYPHWLSSLLIPTCGAGAYGVDLFFALSAYLITSLLLRERATTGILDLRGFYLRRILRIWPLYLAFVAFAAIAGALIPEQHLPMRYVVGYSLLAGNWIYVFYGLPASFAVPLWTVSIEEQFYLAWPLALRKASVRTMAIIAVVLLLVANAWRVWLAVSAAPVERIEYNTFTRLDPIAFGILVALFGHKLPQLSRAIRIALLCGGVATWIAVYAFTVTSPTLKFTTWRMAVGHPFTALASTAVLLSVLEAQHSYLQNSVLLYLGKISYGLYVLHEFAHFCAIRLVHAATPVMVLTQSIVGLALTILLAAASYRWLESPFLRLKERFAHVQSRPV